MKRVLLATIILLALAIAAKAEVNGCYFVYLSNGEVMAYPKEYVKALDNDGNEYRITLVNDSIVRWQKTEADSLSTVSPDYPRFTFFEFNDKHNDQLFSDVEAGIIGDNVKASVGAIGKWLTPTFEMDSEDAVAYVGGKEQVSEVSRLRFASDVTYTLSRPGHQRLSMEKVSDEVWSTPEEQTSEITLSADMLSTNAPTSQEGEGLDMMLDGNTSTFFHSTWSADKVYDVDLTKQVYIQTNLKKAVSKIQFYYFGRHNSSKYNILEWRVEVSNDGSNWKQAASIDEDDGLPADGSGVSYTSPTIEFGGEYTKVRFTAVRVGYKNYLCIGEFKLFEVTGSAGEPQLLQPARYDYRMVPLGREVTVAVDWLTDHATAVPRIDIDIDGGKMVESKEVYLNAKIRIQGNGVWKDFEDSVQIKGRGNISWNEGKPYAKNPYRLKFASSVKPFGMKKGKNWNLIAQAQKGSMMSNPMAMKIARMAGTAAANDMLPVDLYMNGDYRGSYIFTQKVGLANNSVDIDETAAALLEFDRYYDETYKFKSSKYALPVNIKDPDFADEETMITFDEVQADFNRYEDAIYSNTNFERMTDIAMLTRFMLVNELVLNSELGHPKSIFLYRENINHLSSKYTFGPVWDFDWSYNYEDNRQYCVGGETTDILSFQTSRPGHKLFKQLWQGSDIVKAEYSKLWQLFADNHLQELIDYADDYYAFARQSFEKNATKWSDGGNYATIAENMKAWFNTRAAHLLSKYSQASTPSQEDYEVQVLVNSILAPQSSGMPEWADIDKDGKVSVGDVAWLCDKIYKRESPIDPSIMVNGNGNEITLKLKQSDMANVWHLDVGMNNGSPFIAMNLSLNLPKGITVKGGNGGIMADGRLTFAHTLAAAENKENNEWLMIAYSPFNDYIPSSTGNLLSVTLTTDHNATTGNHTISLSDIIAVNGNGIEQQLASADITLNVTETGINDVTAADCSVSYFTPDGKPLAKPGKGIVICRKVYADGRVEIRKTVFE